MEIQEKWTSRGASAAGCPLLRNQLPEYDERIPSALTRTGSLTEPSDVSYQIYVMSAGFLEFIKHILLPRMACITVCSGILPRIPYCVHNATPGIKSGYAESTEFR